MKVIDLEDKYKEFYFVCLEDWSEEMKEAILYPCMYSLLCL
jgi:hypothetical protein